MNTWVVIPTYNESQNVVRLIEEIMHLPLPELSLLIVDDNSPDGTARLVKEQQSRYPQVHLLVREKKMGLGRAYVHGFQEALARGAKAIIQMDADFSHDPQDIPRLVEKLTTHDLVIGSRYSQGISVINWPLRRLLLSTAANTFAHKVTGIPYADITGGFRAWRADTLSHINFKEIDAEGYGFQIVLAHRTWRAGKKIIEVPIIFTERREGQSKMSRRIMWEAFWLVWRLRLLGR
jgi:dolichol-phosphate mannosyltransferase